MASIAKKPKRKPPVWEVYNGQIADMRRQGHTLQKIGDEVGVTRERVRQIIKKHYGEIKTNLLTEHQVSKVIGCPITRLQKLRESGIINPIRRGKRFWFYDRDEIEKVMLALQGNCEHCGVPLPMNNRGKRCFKCKREFKRYNYPFLSDETKERAKEANQRWHEQHPQETREIQRRASKKYRRKKSQEHYAKTQYLVVRGLIMHTGSIFKAIRCENSYLVLENGLKIPGSHVRKIN